MSKIRSVKKPTKPQKQKPDSTKGKESSTGTTAKQFILGKNSLDPQINRYTNATVQYCNFTNLIFQIKFYIHE